MSCKTVFCVIGRDECNQDLMNAINLSLEADAHLSVLIVGVAPSPVGAYNVMQSSDWLLDRETELASIRARQKKVTSLLNVYALSCDVNTEYSHKDWLDDVIGRRARCSDLVVIGPDLLLQPQLRDPTIEGVLFQSSRPALIVPKDAKATLHPKKVMLAWDGSIEVLRATHEAIDILTGAEEVHLTTVSEAKLAHEKEISHDAGIAAYLTRRGANVTFDHLPAGRKTVAKVLSDHAASIGADMVVMGAYGRSRLRERIFGGVTKSMLDAPSLPIFMMR
ncbi:universal stress protein [Phyllobacterium myrsinacearum]|uniref:Nucleotide-binding universal stress UspA family protein n=1 Tax=Phyllobacterium myrsinacearum TaxID=28101 RepID=A0A839ET22_9HYPH|nr:universal stress protein [Phyllobacterium myrsinacearum]MBA8882079.1 nucleotide-binding universal stress UspA family protein [Phyllobacterium myrsinacearum]